MSDLEDDVHYMPEKNQPDVEYVTLVVLNDKQTYSSIDGCKLIVVRASELYEVESSGGDARDFNPIASVSL